MRTTCLKQAGLLTIALTAPTAPEAQVPPPPGAPAPIFTPSASGVEPAIRRPERRLISWVPGRVTCDGRAVEGAALRRPLNQLTWGNPYGPDEARATFAIDARGRAVSIDRPATPSPYSDDIAPALAASRFPANAPMTACSVTYTRRYAALEDVAPEELASYSITPTSGTLPREAWQRMGDGASCVGQPRPAPLTLRFPDFDRLPATEGARDWTMLSYDIDGGGRPRHVRVAYGTRNAALDRAAVAAMEQSRFVAGARIGCIYPFRRNAKVLPAPEMPAPDSFRPADANCPERQWATAPVLRFPEPYRRRAIEGWAIVRYDIAPWGEVGNLSVLAAQPSADFGRTAQMVLRGARAAPSPQGATGCVDRVRFAMGRPGEGVPDEGAPQPPF